MISTQFDHIGHLKRGKVRDVYFQDQSLIIVCCDRISVFDHILPNPIPDKGKILNLLAKFWFEQTEDIIANHIISTPDPNVTIAKRCQPIPIEVVVRGFLAGSIWRDYAKGKREKCGVTLPEGLHKHDALQHPIITPTTKNDSGHDCDINPKELIAKEIITADKWSQITDVALRLFNRGTEILQKRGLILVDTKYEFGTDENGDLILIDEIHTPDSSRFWFDNDPEKTFRDKEFAREWAAQTGFTGKGKIPEIPVEIQQKIRQGYIDIYEQITSKPFPYSSGDMETRIRANLVREGYQI